MRAQVWQACREQDMGEAATEQISLDMSTVHCKINSGHITQHGCFACKKKSSRGSRAKQQVTHLELSVNLHQDLGMPWACPEAMASTFSVIQAHSLPSSFSGSLDKSAKHKSVLVLPGHSPSSSMLQTYWAAGCTTLSNLQHHMNTDMNVLHTICNAAMYMF